MKELVLTDYSKMAQYKFDSISQTQAYKETKIDNNITLIENNLANLNGDYKCVEILETSNKTSDIGNVKDCLIPNKSYINKYNNGEVKMYPLSIKVENNNMTILIGGISSLLR